METQMAGTSRSHAERCLLRSQHRQVKGSLRACMGQGSFSACRKHTFTSAFLSKCPFGLPSIRLGCRVVHFLKTCKLFCRGSSLVADCMLQESRRERVDQHTAACPEYQTANSSTDSWFSAAAGSSGASSALQEPFLSLHCCFSTSPLISRWQKNVCNPAIYF